MMVRIALPLCVCLALAACGTGGGVGDGAEQAQRPPDQPRAVQTETLVGLYEGGKSTRLNQLCVVERDGESRFGLVVWGGGTHSCSGAGQATRSGETLRLTMAGDGECAIAARIDGTSVVFPARVPAGCTYYCGFRASLAGARFEKVGGTRDDALRAQDLVGDPLCG